MVTGARIPPERSLARQVRDQFVNRACDAIKDIPAPVQAKLMTLVDASGNAREMQDRRDAWLAFQRLAPAWLEETAKAWRQSPVAPPPVPKPKKETLSFELIDNEVVENKILASRMALSLLDKVTWELNDLRLRIQSLENTSELDTQDILRPEVLMQIMMDAWAKVGLTREAWSLTQDVVQQQLVDRMVEAYHECNEFLIKNGVMPEIDLRPGSVKKAAANRLRGPSGGEPPPEEGAPDDAMGGGHSGGYAPGSGGGYGGGYPAGGGRAGGYQDGGGGYAPGGGGFGGGAAHAAGTAAGLRAGHPAAGAAGGHNGGGGVYSGYAGQGGGNHSMSGASEETRMLTASSPLARARQRAQGVIGQLKRIINDQVAEFDLTRPTKPSPALASAMQIVPGAAADYELPIGAGGVANVEQVAGALRERTADLKKKATTAAEKATIEIVALMFQSILSEDRIPANVRVWFARLQMPVLRVAIAEPDFFESLQHPARKLIDRMGSCVLGFDAHAITGGALEGEIRRIVQVIEQYPDSGQRVFQLVYDEFQKFLSKFLTEKDGTSRLVGVAQQVEQKETMAIQYTIEMRNLLNDMPVRNEVREFLFKVWAEVLAIAAMKNGPQHNDTVMLKKTAADLVWAASAKPNRNDRARVIQDLPQLLQRLRQGMKLVGLPLPDQENHIKIISDTLADAFMSKTDAIPQEKIEELTKRLSNLEDFIDDEGEVGDLPLDADSIELMLGIDASNIVVITDGGSTPTEAMVSWALELQPGSWFTLDHNGKVTQVQFAWRSDRKQLNLFASSDGLSYLVQARRLASYLQAGLLVPIEEEALTVRATRDALTKLNANPERLLET